MAKLEIPETVLKWLCQYSGSVLNLGASPRLIRDLLAADNRVIALHSRLDLLERLSRYFPQAKASGKLVTIAGQVQALPLRPQIADLILVNKALEPCRSTDEMHKALSQLARVLSPKGYVAGMQMIRDDSVPWVRRFITLMRTVDPKAMPSQSQDFQTRAVLSSKYFPEQQHRDFRIWVPISLDELKQMVSSQDFFKRQHRDLQEDLLDATAQIFNNACANDQLRLPYLARCWRARVAQNELTTPISLDGDVLRILLN